MLAIGMLAVFSSSSGTAASLSNGSLSVTIRDTNGAIGAVVFAGTDFYNAGTPVSNYGFQNGTSTSTFSRARTDGFVSGPIAISSVTSVGSSIRVAGSYTGGGGSVDFVRTYSLVPGHDVLQIQLDLTNRSTSSISLRWYDTFDPDQGSSRGHGFETYNDVFEISTGQLVGQATETGGLSVVMGSTSPGSIVAAGGPFEIDSGSTLNTFFASPVDGGGVLSDQGLHVGAGASIAAGASTTLVYYQAYGTTAAAARSAFLDAVVKHCFAIDAVDDLYQVINDGSTQALLVLANDECNDDKPISIVAQPGDLVPDRGGVAVTDGTKVSYVPASGFVGFEEFRYTAQDAGLAGSPAAVDRDTARIVVNVLQNLVPIAADDTATTQQGQAVVIDVLANDTGGNLPNQVTIATPPAHGSATVQADGKVRYVPNTTFFGPDTFQYRLTDANGDSDLAEVTVGVYFTAGTVPIDVMPNDAGNNINLRSGPGSGFDVAILSVGEYFDAPTLIDPLTLKLGVRGANIWGDSGRARDVNGDGHDDLVVKFLTDQTGIACGDTSVNLSGQTYQYRSIDGSDAVNTFNCPRARKRY